MLLALVLVAWATGRAGTVEEFFAAGRRAGGYLVGLAGTAAAVSAFTFVGGPGLFLMAGAGSLWIILSAPVTGALQCWALGERAVRLTLRHNILTVPELVAGRHCSGWPRGVAALVVAAGCVASLAVQVKATAVVGVHLLALPGWLAAGTVLATTTMYAVAGGMRASLVAEAVQGAVMAAVALVLAGAALTAAGGPVSAVATLRELRPDLLGSFGTVPPGRAASWYLLFCLGTLAQPHYIQKFLFLRSRQALHTLPAVLTASLAATLAVWLGIGLAGAALVARGVVTVTEGDELTPAVLVHLGPWAMVLGAAAVLAAVMSTSASFLNLAAAALTRDLPEASGRRSPGVPAARLATVAVAGAALALGLGSDRAVAMLGVAGWGFFTAALLPAVLVGLQWPGATSGGVTAAMAGGATLALSLELFRDHLPPALEPGLAGAAAGTVLLVAISLARPPGRQSGRARPYYQPPLPGETADHRCPPPGGGIVAGGASGIPSRRPPAGGGSGPAGHR